MANIRWGRILLAAVAAEVIVTLLILVASTVFKVPGELAGYYVAAPASAAATFLMVLTGGFIFTAKPEDRWMYAASFVLRIVGGYLGGLVAQKPAAIREARVQ